MSCIIVLLLSLLAISIVSANPTHRSSDLPSTKHYHYHLRALTASGSTEHIPNITDHHNIGEDVVDNDGSTVIKSGHISCFSNFGPNGVPLDVPILSKKIFKYCAFSISNNNYELGYSSGYNTEDGDDDSTNIDNLFQENTKIVHIREELYFSPEKPDISTVYYCKQTACNVPVSFISFFEYNYASVAKKNSILQKFGYKLV